MPITEALKKLIKTITGKNAVGETIEELVTNLNDNYPEGGGGGGSVTVDSELDTDSTNPVQNKVITAALNERPDDFIITADLDPETDEITKASASLADVLAVADEGRNIVFILHTAAEIGGTTVNVYDRFADSNIENHGGGNGVVSFSKIEKDSGTPIMFSIIAASGDQNGKWVYDEVTLAAATP